MKAAGKKYDPVIYDGAGHGFMRAGQAPDANDANKKAWDEGFKRMLALMSTSSAPPAPAAAPSPHSTPQPSAAAKAIAAHASAMTTAAATTKRRMDMAAIMKM